MGRSEFEEGAKNFIEHLRAQKHELDKKIKAVETALALMRREDQSQAATATPLNQPLRVPQGICNMKQYEALEALARENGKKIRIAEAIPVLQRSGLLRSNKHARQVVYGIMKRRANWLCLEAGEYGLIDKSSAQNEEDNEGQNPLIQRQSA